MNRQTQQFTATSADEAVRFAAQAARGSADAFHEALECIPAPVYVTDSEGWVTFFNSACINFAGRIPVVGDDRWCVTWRLMTEDGTYLPHEECPMAVAIKEKREVRGAIAIAERPDGTKVLFTPFPTPIYSDDDTFVGAVNMLVDITEQRQAASLEEQARRCRRLAKAVIDDETKRTLRLMAEEYEAKARALSAFIR